MNSDSGNHRTHPKIMVLDSGSLYSYSASGKAWSKGIPIESAFIQKIQERQASEADRNGWKDQSPGWQATRTPDFLGTGAAGISVDTQRTARFTAMTRHHGQDSIFYALQTVDGGGNTQIGGLFRYDLDDGYETRLAHRQGLVLEDLHQHPTSGRLITSLPQPNGTHCLATMDEDGRNLTAITDGDCFDQAPSWSPLKPNADREVVIYQSAGVGRDEYGNGLGVAPYAILELDLSSGTVQTLYEDQAHDYLLPQLQPDGSTLCIRRPYLVAGHDRARPLDAFKEILALPYHFFATIFAIFNTVSGMLRNQPLMSAGGPEKRGPDMKRVFLYGRWVQVQKQKAGKPPAPLVDESWELIRLNEGKPEAQVTVLRKNVLFYDVRKHGALLISDGVTVRAGRLDGDPKDDVVVTRGRRIDKAVWVAD